MATRIMACEMSMRCWQSHPRRCRRVIRPPSERTRERPATTSTYSVVARVIGGGQGSYTISVHEDDFRNDISNAQGSYGAIAQPGVATGTINYGGDRDVFEITLTSGRQYFIDLAGNTLSGTLVGLYDAAGIAIATDKDSGPGPHSRIVYTATAIGKTTIAAISATASVTTAPSSRRGR